MPASGVGQSQSLPGAAARGEPGPREPRDGPLPPWAEGVLRVSDTLQSPMKVKNVDPVYPEAAQQAGVTGVVVIDARIEPDGRVRQARILRALPPLDRAALDAVLQWEFTPTLLNGRPIPVLLTVTVRFSLA